MNGTKVGYYYSQLLRERGVGRSPAVAVGADLYRDFAWYSLFQG
jgi:hypothetical protein